MRRLFCYGKADYCDKDTCTGECEFNDGSGSEYRRIETMADRIRSMSYQELAKFLDAEHDYCKNLPKCAEALNTDDGIPDGWCISCILQWLRQPTEKPPLPFGFHDDRQESGLLEDD